MKLQATQKYTPVIPTASMADIAFLLIIFFMLTITFEVDKTRVALPQSFVRTEIPKKAAYVVVTNTGLIKVSDGEEMSSPVPGAEDVLSFASAVVAMDPHKEFVIKADDDVTYDRVDKVIDALKQAKVEVIYLLSEQESVDG